MGLTVLVFEPHKPSYIRVINDDCHEFEEIVGGYSQRVRTGRKDIALICHDAGMLLGLPQDRGFYGSFFLIGMVGNRFVSLNREQIATSIQALEHRKNYTSDSQYIEAYFTDKKLENVDFSYEVNNFTILLQSTTVVNHIIAEKNQEKLSQYEEDIKEIDSQGGNIYDYLRLVGGTIAQEERM